MSVCAFVDSVIYLCLVAILWGVTNPFMKKGAQGLEDVKATSFYGQFIKELVFLVTSLKVCHIPVYILLIFSCKCNGICNLFSLHSTFCRFFLISVVRYCTS